jgi:hypothetical protein
VALHYLLPELSLKEVKAIIQQVMGGEATDEDVAQIYSPTGGVHRHVDRIVPRIRQLAELNREALAAGEGEDESTDRAGRGEADGRVKYDAGAARVGSPRGRPPHHRSAPP